MTDHDDYLQSSRGFRVGADVTALMLKGAGFAALGCAGLLLIAFVLLGISAVLPEASKEAADPTPDVSMAAPPQALPFA